MGKQVHKEFKVGDKVGYLVLLEDVYKLDENRKRKFWKCKCTRCGNISIIREDQLRDPKIKSCGCLRFYRFKQLKCYNNK